jgi:hypothetical protein
MRGLRCQEPLLETLVAGQAVISALASQQEVFVVTLVRLVAGSALSAGEWAVKISLTRDDVAAPTSQLRASVLQQELGIGTVRVMAWHTSLLLDCRVQMRAMAGDLVTEVADLLTGKPQRELVPGLLGFMADPTIAGLYWAVAICDAHEALVTIGRQTAARVRRQLGFGCGICQTARAIRR